jgi:hypothetical protein
MHNICDRLLQDGKESIALVALRRRKHYGDLLHQCEEHILTIDQLISNVEIAVLHSDLVRAVEKGTNALKAIQSELSLDYVARLLEENSVLQEGVAEVSDLMKVSDDSDLLEEFHKIQEEINQDKISEVPSPPTTIPPLANTEQRVSNSRILVPS